MHAKSEAEHLEFFVRRTSVPRLSDGYASLSFKYCDEHPDFSIKLLTKLVKKLNARVIFNTQKKTNQAAQKKLTEVKLIKSFKNWKIIAEKH